MRPYVRLLPFCALLLLSACKKEEPAPPPPAKTEQAPAAKEQHPPAPADWKEVKCHKDAGGTFDVDKFYADPARNDPPTYITNTSHHVDIEWFGAKDFEVLEFTEANSHKG